MAKEKDKFLKISEKTKTQFDALKVEFWWVNHTTHDQKLAHLVWFYKSYKNNNK